VLAVFEGSLRPDHRLGVSIASKSTATTVTGRLGLCLHSLRTEDDMPDVLIRQSTCFGGPDLCYNLYQSVQTDQRTPLDADRARRQIIFYS
jgi:hypothetical protein